MIVRFIEEDRLVVVFTTNGANGAGVPAGGSAGQILAKSSGVDYETEWIDPPSSVLGFGQIAFGDLITGEITGNGYFRTDGAGTMFGSTDIPYLKLLDGIGAYLGYNLGASNNSHAFLGNNIARITSGRIQLFSSETATDMAFRLDAAGIRLGKISTMGSANTLPVEWDLNGNTTVKWRDGGTHIIANSNALWLNATTIAGSNYTLAATAFTTLINAPSNITMSVNGSLVLDASNILYATPISVSSGSPTVFMFRLPGNTGQTAGAETIGWLFNGATNSIQHATGAIATQRDFLISARTHRFVGASTITDAGTLVVSGPPLAGTNATITNPYSLWSQSGRVRLQGLPTSSAGLQSGELWNDSGTLKIV